MILFSRRGILGCATDFGGPTSHVSIMARALGLPAVVSMHNVTEKIESGEFAEEWQKEAAAGNPRLGKFVDIESAHPIESAGVAARELVRRRKEEI